VEVRKCFFIPQPNQIAGRGSIGNAVIRVAIPSLNGKHFEAERLESFNEVSHRHQIRELRTLEVPEFVVNIERAVQVLGCDGRIQIRPAAV